jgi:hypothetical protein
MTYKTPRLESRLCVCFFPAQSHTNCDTVLGNNLGYMLHPFCDAAVTQFMGANCPRLSWTVGTYEHCCDTVLLGWLIPRLYLRNLKRFSWTAFKSALTLQCKWGINVLLAFWRELAAQWNSTAKLGHHPCYTVPGGPSLLQLSFCWQQ